MKKIIILLTFLVASLATNAQKKKTTTKPPTNATALTKNDANDFIVYSNSVALFFESYFVHEKQEQAYSEYVYNTANPKNAFRCEYKLDEKAFEQAKLNFNDYIIDASTEYVQLSKTPVKMNAAKATQLKQLYKDYEASYLEIAQHFNQKIAPLYDLCVPIKTANKDTISAQLTHYKKNVSKLNGIYESIITISDALGEDGENIILAGHPYKNEIIDMRTLLKLVRKPTELILNTDRENVAQNEPELQKYIAEMTAFKTKYATYSTQGKTDKDVQMRKEVITFFKNIDSFKNQADSFLKCVKDKSCKDYYLKEEYQLINQIYESFGFNYSQFVNSNNRD